MVAGCMLAGCMLAGCMLAGFVNPDVLKFGPKMFGRDKMYISEVFSVLSVRGFGGSGSLKSFSPPI